MKIFEGIQRYQAILGISSSKQPVQERPFNIRVALGFLILSCLIASQFVYIFHVASGFMEYMVCICSISANTIILIDFVWTIFQNTSLLETTENLEKLIDTSNDAGLMILQKEISFECHFRVWISKSEDNFLENPSTSRTIEWNCFHVANENIITKHNTTKMYC